MKTKTQVLKEYPEQKRLINAVVNRVGLDSVEDVYNYGADAGFCGFTYYSDTVAFFKRHKKDILSLAHETSQQLGEDLLSMIQNFRCLGKDYSQDEIGQAIYGRGGELQTQIQNAMAWFALEEVCRMFED